ncbi:MAG: GTP-binding protein [Betaproteobacteria bacterium]|nr:MAG: GTP-binding protein [Betaproteobacteria bacterium]
MSLLGEIERNPPAVEDRGVLRFITAGSVDDGKSTLIGRLLHDTRAIFEDQLAAVARASSKRGQDALDLSLLTDGLEAEREQGITIDVAYRYFATPRRKFIIADTPGHEQYTRNMVTGASTADAAVILVDARKGVLPQTRRHTYIAHLLGVRHIVVAVNKMDLVGSDEATFECIRRDFLAFASALGIVDLRCIPISALRGDFVVERGELMRWYRGPTLLAALEEIDVADEADALPLRFPVQLAVRPGAGTDFRGYSGRIESGTVFRGAEVLALPSGRRTVVKDIVCLESSLPVAVAGDSVTLTLADDIDISRGDLLAEPTLPPRAAKSIEARLCWLSAQPLDARALPVARFVLKHTTRSVRAKLVSLNSRVDVDTLERHTKPTSLAMNDIAHVALALAQPLFVDSYELNRATGSFILIDEASNQTVAAGMIDG